MIFPTVMGPKGSSTMYRVIALGAGDTKAELKLG